MSAPEIPFADQAVAPIEMDATDPTHLSGTSRFAAACVAVAAAVSLMSCTSEGAPTETEERDNGSVAAAPLATPTPRPELPNAPCEVFNLNTLTRAENIQEHKDKAKACAQVMKSGSVALITSGIPLKQAQKIADAIEQDMPQETNGKLNPEIKAIQASDAAEKRWKDTIAQTGCVDISNPETFASYSADAAMPELAKYDHILSLTDSLACTPKTPGVASNKGGRHAEVFVPAVKKSVLAGGNPDDVFKQIGGHELGHQYGLGHDGEIVSEQPGGFYSPVVLVGPKVTDILGLAAKGKYEEYATGPMMGAPVQKVGSTTGYDVQPIDPVQQNCLNWPAVALNGPKADKAETVGSKGVTITAKEAADGKFAYVDLDTPIEIKPEGDTAMPPVGGIAIVPRVENDGSKKIYESDVVLTADEGCTVVSMGYTDGPDKWSFQAGGKTYKVDLNANRIKVSSAS